MMGKCYRTRDILLSVLSDGEPKSALEIVGVSGLSKFAVWDGLHYWWKQGLLLRSEKPIFEGVQVFRGRAGIRKNTREKK